METKAWKDRRRDEVEVSRQQVSRLSRLGRFGAVEVWQGAVAVLAVLVAFCTNVGYSGAALWAGPTG